MPAISDRPAARRQVDDLLAVLAGPNGEGMVGAAVDAAVGRVADGCDQCREALRGWRWAVFTAEEPYDPAVEAELLTAANRLRADSRKLLAASGSLRPDRHEPGPVARLAAAVDALGQVLDGWTRPERSLLPAFRVRFTPEETEQIRAKAAEVLRQAGRDYDRPAGH